MYLTMSGSSQRANNLVKFPCLFVKQIRESIYAKKNTYLRFYLKYNWCLTLQREL